jgi:hypothetical protein
LFIREEVPVTGGSPSKLLLLGMFAEAPFCSLSHAEIVVGSDPEALEEEAAGLSSVKLRTLLVSNDDDDELTSFGAIGALGAIGFSI